MINVQTSHLVLRSKSFNQLGTNNIRAYMVWVERYLPNGNMISTSVRIALPVEMTLVCNLKCHASYFSTLLEIFVEISMNNH